MYIHCGFSGIVYENYDSPKKKKRYDLETSRKINEELIREVEKHIYSYKVGKQKCLVNWPVDSLI